MKTAINTLFLAALFILSGCATSVKTSVYTLGEPNVSPAQTAKNYEISITKVKLPSYLEGTPIVKKIDEFEVNRSNTSVWANPFREEVPLFLEKAFDKILIEQRDKLPKKRINLEIRVLQFDIGYTKIQLNAKWKAVDENQKLVKKGTISIKDAQKILFAGDLPRYYSKTLSTLAERIISELK